MNITFTPLTPTHFPLLLKWLLTPHVRMWWDWNVSWTPELIKQKYINYTKGYKRLILQDQIIEKPIHAYIIHHNKIPIGYIQHYNKHDFPPEQGYEVTRLPDDCAAIDWYIGELEYINKGIGSKSLELFLKLYVFPHFENVFVDPDTANIGAIKAYENVGFKVLDVAKKDNITLMLKKR